LHYYCTAVDCGRVIDWRKQQRSTLVCLLSAMWSLHSLMERVHTFHTVTQNSPDFCKVSLLSICLYWWFSELVSTNGDVLVIHWVCFTFSITCCGYLLCFVWW